MNDTITFARPVGNLSLAKVIHVQGGRIIGKDPSPNVGTFDYREVEVDGLRSLYIAVRDAAKRGEIAIRAKPKGPRGNRRMHRRADGIEPFCDPVPRCWCAFDWDGLPLELQPCPNPRWSWEPCPLREPWIGAQIALRRLPPQFRDASLFWQVSAGAGYNPGFRLRTWHWLDFPVTGNEFKTWLKPAIDRHLLDPVTTVEVQPHYLAVQVKGGDDPCPRRFGYILQARQAVPVPDIQGIKRRQEEIEREKRPPRTNGTLTSHSDDPDQANAEQRIADCLAAIRSASARHTTYKSEAARAKAIVEKYGLDWQPIRRKLIDAYESKLTDQERRERRSFSTEGVLEWLEGRSAA
jgi:hypothetical protein